MEEHKRLLKDNLKNGRNGSISSYIPELNLSTARCQFNIHVTRKRDFQIIRSSTTAWQALEHRNTTQAGQRESCSAISTLQQSRTVLPSNRQNCKQCIE